MNVSTFRFQMGEYDMTGPDEDRRDGERREEDRRKSQTDMTHGIERREKDLLEVERRR